MKIGFPTVAMGMQTPPVPFQANSRLLSKRASAVNFGSDGFLKQTANSAKGVKFSGAQSLKHSQLNDQQLVGKFPPLLQQVLFKAREMAMEFGSVEIQSAHVLGAMVNLLEELTQWQAPLNRRNRENLRGQREQADQLAAALLPNSNLSPDAVVRQLKPFVNELHRHVTLPSDAIDPAQMRLQPSLRQSLETVLDQGEAGSVSVAGLVSQLVRQDADGVFGNATRATRRLLEDAHRADSPMMDFNMEMDTDEEGPPPTFFDALREKSPVLAKWVELGSLNPKDRFFDQFEAGPLAEIVSKGIEMANREVNVGKRRGPQQKSAPIGRNLESLNALIPPEMRRKQDKAHLTAVLTNAQRKLKELPKSGKEQNSAEIAKLSRQTLEDFMYEPGREDFSVAAFVEMLREKSANEPASELAKMLPDALLTEEQARIGQILNELREEAQDKRLEATEQFEKSCPAVMKNSTNLVRQGMQGHLPEVLMRREVTDRMLAMINSGGARTNLLLNTGSGEGKTYVVLGLAQRLAADDIPKSMQNTQMVQLDLARVLSNSQFRGEFEKVVKEMFDQLNRYLSEHPKQKVIVFMDEIHMLSGDDASTMLDIMKSSGILEQKNLSFIGATTPEDWRKSSLRKDQAFLGRFHDLALPGFSAQEKLAILGRQARDIERQMGVEIQPDILEKVLQQASAKWPDNTLRHSIDVIRLSASLAKNAPLEQASLRDRLQRKELWMETLQAQKSMKGRFLRQMAETGREIEELKAQIQTSEPPKGDTQPVRDKHVRQALAVLTGEKIGVMGQDELSKLHRAKDVISDYIVGQPDALTTVEEALQEIAVRQKTGEISKRPIVSMLLPGPTGVGKTELAKVIAKEFMNGNFIRVDMSDYMEKHSISRFTGTAPGYVGFEDGGMIDKVRKNPQSVIVFDEIEKAHPDVFNILLQMLEEGEILDNQNQPVSFRNAIIVLTSNLNNQQISELLRQHRKKTTQTGKAQDPQLAARELETKVRSLLTAKPAEDRAGFQPEQLGRIDYVIPFSPLTRQNVSEILDIRLKEMNQVPFLKDNNLDIQLSPRARSRLIDLAAASGLPAEEQSAILGGKRANGSAPEELSLQGGARDVRSNFDRFVRKKVFTDLTFNPKLTDLENARITVDYAPEAQAFRLQAQPVSTGENALPYAMHFKTGRGKTLAFA